VIILFTGLFAMWFEKRYDKGIGMISFLIMVGILARLPQAYEFHTRVSITGPMFVGY
jgi:preprotein translocase subunit SecY